MHLRSSMALVLALGGAVLTALPAAGQTCQARSAAQQTTLIELYTSEGCDSCPPADRFASSLNGRADVLVAAFHVDYWDRLGWKDRFGDPRFSQRQAAQRAHSGARFEYTPQLLLNGRDWKRSAVLPKATRDAVVAISLQRQGDEAVLATVQALRGAPPQLGLWWAALEDGHASVVKTGENSGHTLRHDHVVRRYEQLPAWNTNETPSLNLGAPRRGEAGRRVRTLVVVTDGATGAPLQAVQLDC